MFYAFMYVLTTFVCLCVRIIDNMPVTSCYITEDQKAQSKSICYPSFPVGCYVGKDLKGKDDCHSLVTASLTCNVVICHG